MSIVPANITAEVMERADGRPVAYIDATAVAVFAYQEPDGTHVIEIVTRDDIPPGKLRLLLDGRPLATDTTVLSSHGPNPGVAVALPAST